MAKVTTTLRAELDLCLDALSDIERIFRALATRHGDDYRRLEQRIERLYDDKTAWGEVKTHMLAEGIVLFEPWPVLQDIIRDARALGILR